MGDLAHEPGAKCGKLFSKKGYEINLNRVQTLDDVENGPFSQYSMYYGGGLIVNYQPVPMLQFGWYSSRRV
jgi:hypothetical protein